LAGASCARAVRRSKRSRLRPAGWSGRGAGRQPYMVLGNTPAKFADVVKAETPL